MADDELKPQKQEQSVKYQYFAAIIVNILSICYGMNCGWTSPSIVLLKSDECPLPSSKISMEEASWIASLSTTGGFLGNIFFGLLSAKFGRKSLLIAMAFPNFISWLLILLAQNVYFIYVARVLTGFVGGGVFVIIPLYLSEIANDSVRGALGVLLMFGYNIGVLISFTLANYCNYFMIPKVVMGLTALYLVSFLIFPETPIILVKKNRIQNAEKSIEFYQNLREKDNKHEIIHSEIDRLKIAIISASDKPSGSSFSWSDLMTNRARKAMTIGIVLTALNQFSGCCAMLFYISIIFEASGSNLTPNMSAILVGAIQLVGSIVATNLIDRAGRKFLFAVSTIGTALGFIALGVYMLLKSMQIEVEAFNWIPVASFSFVIFVASLAILPLPFLVISEILPENIKDFGMSFCNTLGWIFTFISIKYLPFLMELLDLHGSMFLFAAVCVSSAFYILLCMPETKGKSYEEIMELLK